MKFSRLLDKMDDDLARQRAQASLATKRSGSTPATKSGQDIAERKDDYQGEVKAKGGGTQTSPTGVEGVKRVHAVSAHTDDNKYESQIGVQHEGPHHPGPGEVHDGKGPPTGDQNNSRVAGQGKYKAVASSDRNNISECGHPDSAIKSQACEYCSGTGKRGGGSKY